MNNELKTKIRAALDSGRYEATEDGRVLLPADRLIVGGYFTVSVNGAEPTIDPNIVPNEGLDHILDVVFHGGTQITTWYIAPFSGNVTPLATWTAANVTANSTEFTGYSETTRQEWVEAAVSAQSITNTASRAVFSITSSATLYGAFMVSVSTKSGTTGKLIAATRFAASRAVVNTDVLNIGYTISASST